MQKRPQPLSVRDVGELLARSPRARDAILVGGQALNVWAVYFGLLPHAAAVSNDIDFFGSGEDAIGAGLDWGAEVRTAAMDDHTPNVAIALLEIEGDRRAIDFLDSILGVDSAELRRWSSLVRDHEQSFRVMHPLHVLGSQLENVYGMLKRRDEDAGEYYVGRVTLAVRVASSAITELLDGKKTRDALKAAERIAVIAQSGPALEAFRRDAIDALEAIPDHGSWPKKFIDPRLVQVRQAVETGRRKYIVRVQRRAGRRLLRRQ